MNLSAMALSKPLSRIYASGCYIELDYKSMGAYTDKLAEETFPGDLAGRRMQERSPQLPYWDV
jgi:hypothetical protein